jgi:D-serine deaminase-like pyridoxal phosphate-dependent protein
MNSQTKFHSETIVTEESVQRALDYLRDSAEEIGRLTTLARGAEHMVKVNLALEMKNHDGPVSAQEREARTSDRYLKALSADANAAGELAKAKALREAAAMRIEVWRTQSSNWRSMKL